MFRFGWVELVIILVLVLIIFGVGKLPQVGSSIGKGLREFRKGIRGESDEEAKPTSKESSELKAEK